MAAIGLLTLDIHLQDTHSLKEKRHVLLRLKDRLSNKFNVAVAELDYQDLWQRAAVGVVSISSSEKNLRQVLEGAEQEAEQIIEEFGSVVSHIEML
jgi:uncharacterized protein YlxP (DUF503 family)